MNRIRPYLTAFAVLCLTLLGAGLVEMLSADPLTAGVTLVLATGVAVLDRPIAQAKADLAKLLPELEAGQAKMAEGKLTQAEGEALEAKFKEAEALQNGIDAHERRQGIVTRGKEVPNPVLPASAAQKTRGHDGEIAGYLTLGEAVVSSPQYKQFLDANFPKGTFPLLVVPELRRGFVPLTKSQREEWESKATPTLGTGVLDPQRLGDIVQETADDQNVLRDVLNLSRTNANSVEYVREETYTRAATMVAHGAAKPEGTVEYTLQSTTVRTIAVWIPATVQMLADWPALRNLIDNRLLYDLRREEEEQVMYGDGTGQNFAGIIPNAGHDIAVADARITSPTIIDQIRVGMTEVRTSGYQPNALVIHPIDWEAVVLSKGSDEHYLAQVFPAADGTMRVWGLNVVESVSTESTNRVVTQDRNFVVGDFRRGATLWIREEANVMVGMKNDDFTKNLRTILAEERAAFAVQAPDAFATMETQAGADV